MIASKRELLDKIRLGESSYLELKEVRFSNGRVAGPHRDAVADTLAAFANAHGGTFVLGVQDNPREIVGIPLNRLDQTTNFVRDICSDSIDPPIENVVLDRVTLPNSKGEDVPVIKIEVPPSLFIHRSPSGFLHRVGDSKRTMSTEYLARMFAQRSQTRLIRFDEQIVHEATLDDLPPELWHSFRTSRTGDDREDMLSKLGMARLDENGAFRPTVAGVLMAAKDPRQWIPNAFVQAVSYRGTEVEIRPPGSHYQLDAADICGPLQVQIRDACVFVAKNMKVRAFKDQGRFDLPQYDLTAVFEALVNAVAHRDYSIYGSKIRLRMFEDRIEIYSPGSIPNSLGVERLPHIQSTRNELITSLLAKCPVTEDFPNLVTSRRTLMDRRGEGVPVILDRSLGLSGREPEYRQIGDAELVLTIYAAEPEHSPLARSA